MSKKDYDVVIIGAGISGLVCGCYLAKAGLKTLIVEKNAKPGGYCTSFRAKGFHFDACAHALSSLRDGGILNRILRDLGMLRCIDFNKSNPSDVIVTSNFKIKIFSEVNRTVAQFQKCFPKDKEKLKEFFTYLTSSDSFFKLRSKTFNNLLDSYFKSRELKNILGFVVSALSGTDSSQVSAIIGCLLYKEFIFDGGYYPVGGMQVLPDRLLDQFSGFKGDKIFGRSVEKIDTWHNKAKGVILDDDRYVSARYIVSACDVRQVFSKMIEDKSVGIGIRKGIKKTLISSSVFLVYLGINKSLQHIQEFKSNIFLFSKHRSGRVKNAFNCSNVSIRMPSAWDTSINSNGNNSLICSIGANYKSDKYWNIKKRDDVSRRIIKLTERIIPGLSRCIDFKMVASPFTLHRWTNNYHGAAFGWASTPKQFGNPDFSQKTTVSNLYLTGHWANQSSGVGLAANCGRDTASLILKRQKL